MDSQTKQIQTKRTFEAFRERPKTMMEVSIETGIIRPNICRYISKWEKQGKIVLVKEDTCPITKHKAGFYSTDPTYFPDIDPEPELFDIPEPKHAGVYSR
ncbi:MAG TPA: hypothetical protein VJ964_00025 [Balneolaceae bacterium]|nr:hypothetical protein [Balneolaceae bacterium]